MENYLIDLDVITEIMKDEKFTKVTRDSEGAIHRILRDLAVSQLDEVADREVFNGYGYLNSSLRAEDVSMGDLAHISKALFARVKTAQHSLNSVGDEASWCASFEAAVEAKAAELLLVWEAKWKELCDGKKLLSKFHKVGQFRMSEASLKQLIARKMKDTESEGWQLARGLVEKLMGSVSST